MPDLYRILINFQPPIQFPASDLIQETLAGESYAVLLISKKAIISRAFAFSLKVFFGVFFDAITFKTFPSQNFAGAQRTANRARLLPVKYSLKTCIIGWLFSWVLKP